MADPTFTIYTLGEIGIFEAALTGVAMLFNPTNTELWVSSSSALGLGALAGLGLLITLFILLMNGVMTQKFELGTFIMLIIVYCILFVPKFKVQIEDIYSGSITAVDGIPLGVAVPASLVSNGTYEIAKNLEVAFSTIQGNYVSLSAQGFVSPLRLLNQLRMGNKRACSMGPDLCATIHTAVQDCLIGRTFDFGAYNKSTTSVDDVINYLKASTGGITMFYGKTGSPAVLYPYPNGKVVNCSDAGTAIETAVNAFMFTPDGTGKTEVDKLLNMGVKSTGSGTPYTKTEYDNAFTMMNGVSSTEGDAFMKTALFAPTINNAAFCANNAATHADLSKCMPMISAVEQWKEDSAAAGSMFTRVMVHGMNIMLFMFYVFAPIIAVVIVAVGVRGLKIAASYLMFGIWTQTWLPVAAMVNFYVQVQVEREVARAKASGVSMFTPEGMYTFYDMLSTKVAMAGDMMASVPLISLGLMSGSMYAVTSIAQRMGGKDYYDEKTNTPSHRGNAPLHAPSAGTASVMGSGMTEVLGSGQGVTFGTTQALANRVSQTQTASVMASKKFGETFAKTLTDTASKTHDVGSIRQLASSLDGKLATSLGTDLNQFADAMVAKEKADKQVKELSIGDTVSEGSSFTRGGSLKAGTGPLPVGGQIHAGYDESTNRAHVSSEAKKTAMEKALKEQEAAGSRLSAAKQKVATTTSGLSYQDAKSVADRFTTINQAADSTQLSRGIEQVQSAQEAAQRAREAQQAMSTGISHNALTFARDKLQGQSPALDSKLLAESQKLMTNDATKADFAAAKMAVSQGAARDLPDDVKNKLAAAYYHLSRGTQEGGEIAEAMSGIKMDTNQATNLSPGSLGDVKAAGADVANRGASVSGAEVSDAQLDAFVRQRQKAIAAGVGSGGIAPFMDGATGSVIEENRTNMLSQVGPSNYVDEKIAIDDALQKFGGNLGSAQAPLQNLSNFLGSNTGLALQGNEKTEAQKIAYAGTASSAISSEIQNTQGQLKSFMQSGRVQDANQLGDKLVALNAMQKAVNSVSPRRQTYTTKRDIPN